MADSSAFDEGFNDGIEAFTKLGRLGNEDYERGRQAGLALRTRVQRKYHVRPLNRRSDLRLLFHIRKELEHNPTLRTGEGDLADERL